MVAARNVIEITIIQLMSTCQNGIKSGVVCHLPGWFTPSYLKGEVAHQVRSWFDKLTKNGKVKVSMKHYTRRREAFPFKGKNNLKIPLAPFPKGGTSRVTPWQAVGYPGETGIGVKQELEGIGEGIGVRSCSATLQKLPTLTSYLFANFNYCFSFQPDEVEHINPRYFIKPSGDTATFGKARRI